MKIYVYVQLLRFKDKDEQRQSDFIAKLSGLAIVAAANMENSYCVIYDSTYFDGQTLYNYVYKEYGPDFEVVGIAIQGPYKK